MSSNYTGFEIAIIGMAGRFPGSNNIKELWNNICEGKNLISYFTNDELKKYGISQNYLEDKNYVKARGIIKDADKFDADLFNFYPKEAEMLDPQQRIFLECVWEALEDAGYCPDNIEQITGIFGGVGMNTYILQFLESSNGFISSAEGYKLSLGNDKDFLTTRVSYKLNLKGPSINIQTACSTSLVATHLACMNLLNYQCDLAIAGGVTISFPQYSGYHYQEGMILAPDGVCRPFDNEAKGTVPANGAGVVVLKRLEDALRDNDDIYAIIKGSAYNNDGAVKVGYAAPSVEGQRDVIISALAVADVPAETIMYVETHGTGTPLGDPIEIDALTQAFRTQTDKNNFCAIGSIKSNLGHLDTAAGITGLIKTALSIYYGKIPPSINFNKPNEKINIINSPFYVNTKLTEWNKDNSPRRASVSSFGIGGTNVHVVLEESPKKSLNIAFKDWQLLISSGKSQKVLDNININLVEFIKQNKPDLQNLAFTLQTGRKYFNYRSYFLVKNEEHLSKIANSENSPFVLNKGQILENSNIVFLFSGQGSQYINMAYELYETESEFRKNFDECFNILLEDFSTNFKEIIFPQKIDLKTSSDQLNQTEFTQPALFIIEYSLAKTLIEFGITPTFMLGHSIGEYVAACISGVMDLQSALKLVVTRAKLMQKLKQGKMLSVKLSELELRKIIPEELDLAVINAPKVCVVSGEEKDIINFSNSLNNSGIANVIINTSHAFHSKMMDSILDEFKLVLESIELSSPQIPYMSNLTGTFITSENAIDPIYYINHLRYTVRFNENVENLLSKKNIVFLEVGPGSILTNLVKQNPLSKNSLILNTLKSSKENLSDREVLLKTFGQLWLNGINIKWEKLYNQTPSKIHLPTYPFDKKKYWYYNKSSSANRLLEENKILFNINWKRINVYFRNVDNIDDKVIIIFDNKQYSLRKIFEHFISNVKLLFVYQGESFKEIETNVFSISPNRFEDYQTFIETLLQRGVLPSRIIHNWSSQLDSDYQIETAFYKHQNLSFLSIVNILNALSKNHFNSSIEIDIISNNLFYITEQENYSISSSTLIGLSKVIPQENPNINCKLIDIDLSKNFDGLQKIRCLQDAIFNQSNSTIAIRGNYLWKPVFDKLIPNENSLQSLLREKGTYLITGGLGRIGLLFAEHLASTLKAKIILIDQIDLPNIDDWDEIIVSKKEAISDKLLALRRIEQNSEFHYYKGDIGDISFWEYILEEISKKSLKVNGIIHSAGLIGDKVVQFIKDFEYSNFELQTRAKVFGTLKIYETFKDDNFDFVIINSSLASILGGIGFASYSAVNSFIDSFVLNIVNKNNSKAKWISINWEGWNFNVNSNTIKSISNGITPSEGLRIFDNILKYNLPNQIIVSSKDLSKDIFELNTSNIEEDKEETINDYLHERPEISTAYLPPSTDLEIQIAQEWEKVLGVEKIGINDNFFELGGDSLIGTHLVSILREKYNCDIPLTKVFENASISGIADIISKQINNNNNSDSINEMLNIIDKLSDEEAKRILQEKSKTE